MKHLVILAGATILALAMLYEPSQAQQRSVVAACGTQNNPVGSTRGGYQDQTGDDCTNASGGGGGGGAITAPLGTQTLGASIATTTGDGNDVSLGAKADSACATDTGACSAIALIKRTNQNVTTLNTTAAGAVADCGTNPCTNHIGLVDQGRGASATPWTVSGLAASGATDSDVPLNNGGRAATAAPTAVTDGQKVAQQFTPEGIAVTRPYAIKELMVRGTVTSTDTGAHSIIASAGGSLKNYITNLECGRTDAGATAIVLTLSDAASTVVILPSGGATNIAFAVPLATAAATAFSVTSGTSVSTLYCSAQGYTGL